MTHCHPGAVPKTFGDGREDAPAVVGILTQAVEERAVSFDFGGRASVDALPARVIGPPAQGYEDGVGAVLDQSRSPAAQI